jgi:7-cyano-7-deazaguanine synthase
MAKKAILILSGGMDSTTLLAHALADGYDVHALSFDYGQRHSRELFAASQVADHYHIRHDIITLPIEQHLKGSSQTDKSVPVPHGHYAAENMKATVVPNRNMILLSIAIGVAVSEGADTVFYGAHSGDHAIYPDCRPEFVERMDKVAEIANYDAVKVIAPFIGMDKGDIAKRGVELGVPFEYTWTCYEGGEKPCGLCGACQERAEAFAKAGVKDPLLA